MGMNVETREPRFQQLKELIQLESLWEKHSYSAALVKSKMVDTPLR